MKLACFIFTTGAFFSVAAGASAQVSCNTSISPLNFGTYSPFSDSHTDSVASIVLNCSNQTTTAIPYEIRLSSGQSGRVFDRALTSGSSPDDLAYQLYIDPAYSIVWGDGVSGTSASGVISFISPTAISTENIYGRIRSRQSVENGQYSDFVTVSVIF